jgi:nucleoside 2-deoxyribosyltransferase
MNRPIKCFISSASRIDLSVFYQILERLNVNYQNLYDFSIEKPIAEIIKQNIRECDFVVAIIDNNSQNVYYEIGLAEGLNKPVFLLAEKETKIPLYLEGRIYYQIDWSKNTNLVELSLKSYIEDIKNERFKNKKKSSSNKSKKLSLKDTDEIFLQLSKLREFNNEHQISNLLSDLFKKLDIQAVSELKIKDKSWVDMAILNENLSSYFGNLLLIEIKAGNISNDVMLRAEEQLVNYLNKTDASTGLLLYLDRNNRRFDFASQINPNILKFDIEDFVRGIASEGFEKLLMRTRNELVHGKIQ